VFAEFAKIFNVPVFFEFKLGALDKVYFTKNLKNKIEVIIRMQFAQQWVSTARFKNFPNLQRNNRFVIIPSYNF
jgi:hypothetical protein